MAHPKAPRTLDTTALSMTVTAKYFAGRTMFSNVTHLLGGSRLTFHCGELSLRTWWCPQTAPTLRFRDRRDYVELARDHSPMPSRNSCARAAMSLRR